MTYNTHCAEASNVGCFMEYFLQRTQKRRGRRHRQRYFVLIKVSITRRFSICVSCAGAGCPGWFRGCTCWPEREKLRPTARDNTFQFPTILASSLPTFHGWL